MIRRHSDDCDYDPDDDRRSGFCAACGKECVAGYIDEGIGSYEYWGARGVDIRLVEVSDCCEAEVLDDPPEEENDDADE